MKVLVSGNANFGLAKAIDQKIPNCVFWSRSTNGKDLLDESVQIELAEESLNYDAYISCSKLKSFNQLLLLNKVVEKWKQKKHRGKIIVIGSTIDRISRGGADIYSLEKKAIRQYCESVSLDIQGGKNNGGLDFKLTCVSLGTLATPRHEKKLKNEIDLEYVAETIKWIVANPDSINISSLSIDPVQPSLA